MKILTSTMSEPLEIRFLRWAKPQISQALYWKNDSMGIPRARDGGVGRDVYRSKITFQLPDASLSVLQQAMNAASGLTTVKLYDIDAGQNLFGPEVNHAAHSDGFGSYINATWDAPFSVLKRVYAGKVAGWEMTLRLKEVPVPLLGTSPGLGSLRLPPNFTGDTLPSISRAFSYDQTEVDADAKMAAGEVPGIDFIQTPAESNAIMAYILAHRGEAIPTPACFAGLSVFGFHRIAGVENVIIRDWSVERHDLNRWRFRIKFCESVASFTAGVIP